MKKLLPILLSSRLVLRITTVSTEAAALKAKTYKNCTELNKAFKGGVARSTNVENKGGETKFKPYVSKTLYDAN